MDKLIAEVIPPLQEYYIAMQLLHKLSPQDLADDGFVLDLMCELEELEDCEYPTDKVRALLEQLNQLYFSIHKNTYKGFWSFCPVSEMTTHTVKAHTENEAVEMLMAWAFEHQNILDNPCDFEVEQID